MDGKSLGGILLLVIGVLVVMALFPTISTNTAIMTNTYDCTNCSITTAAANTTSGDLAGRVNITAMFISWANDSTVFDVTSNYTVVYTGADGRPGLRLTTSDDAVEMGHGGGAVNASYTYEPDGYVREAGGRGMVNLILIMAALGLLGFVVFYSISKLDIGK